MQVQSVQNNHNIQFNGTLELARHYCTRVPLLPWSDNNILYEQKFTKEILGKIKISEADDKLLYKLFTRLLGKGRRSGNDWFYGIEKTCMNSGIGGSSVMDKNALIELEAKIKNIFKLPDKMKIFPDAQAHFDYGTSSGELIDGQYIRNGYMRYWFKFDGRYGQPSYSIEHILHHKKNSYIPPVTLHKK